jgi:UDP-glucuronate 4-epimerase
MKLLLTGAAGFIGLHTAQALLERGDEVFGLDCLNDYYPVSLKRARLAQLEPFSGFRFVKADVADPIELTDAVSGSGGFDAIVHLAAQAGVRYSLENPYAYVDSNVTGQVAVLELAARLKLPLVYASSSSVYGANDHVPFAETDSVDAPVSVYAATKRAGELLAQVYAGTHGVVATGLRFFTVYGRYGRPDMAPWLFTDAILNGEPVSVFNHGQMERDFTHVSDITAGVVSAIDRIIERPGETAPLYNLGNNRPVRLMDFIAAIENAAGRKAKMEMKPKPAGDVVRTYADITLAARDLGFAPKMPLETGIADFVEWFRGYNRG